MEKKLPKPPQEFSIDDVAYLYTPPPTPSNIILLIPASYPSAPPPPPAPPLCFFAKQQRLSHTFHRSPFPHHGVALPAF